MPVIEMKWVPRHLRVTRKKKVIFYAHEGESVKENLTGTYWDEGSKSDYVMRVISTGLRVQLAYDEKPPHFGGVTSFALIGRDRVLVETGYTRGQASTPTYTIRRLDIPLWLGIGKTPPEMPLPVLNDWLIDQGRDSEADKLREFLEVVGLS